MLCTAYEPRSAPGLPRPANTCCRQYTSKEALWGHFLRGGAYEGRGFRFTCPYDPPKLP